MIVLLGMVLLSSSLFQVTVPLGRELRLQDYQSIQTELNSKHIEPEINSLIEGEEYESLMLERSQVGVHLQLLGDQGQLPHTQLMKIGAGGECCVVTFASYNRRYVELARSIGEELEKVGFNGYLLYQLGGFPNPTGTEIKYVAVPYAFKICMMIDAYTRGFRHVLWIDASLIPLRDPTPLFDHIKQHRVFMEPLPFAESRELGLPMKVRDIIYEETGVNISASRGRHINMMVFGLDMALPETQDLIGRFYKMAEKGFPFVSAMPEEYVISALANDPKYRFLMEAPDRFVVRVRTEDALSIEEQRKRGFYFLSRAH
jgi:hypothetical protein